MLLQPSAILSLKCVHRVECKIFAELFVSTHLTFGFPSESRCFANAQEFQLTFETPSSR